MSTRLIFQNVDGVSESRLGPKQEDMEKWWREEDVGIVLLAEANRYWPSIEPTNRWHERMRQANKKGHYSATAYNRHQDRRNNPSSWQIGGCIASLLGQTAHMADSKGADESGLGRWAWVKIRGKKRGPLNPYDQTKEETADPSSHDLVVIAAYRPNPPGAGQSTVFAQQRQFWLQQNRDVNPRKAFIQDLVKAILRWRDEGCEVILALDANENVSSMSPTSIRHQFGMAGMEEAILRRHHQHPVATFQRNMANIPIDGIFVSPGVIVHSGGYYGFNSHFAAGHRALWLDIDLCKTLGGYSPSKQQHQPRRLSTEIPESVKIYNSLSEEGYLRYDIPRRLANLAENITVQKGYLTERQQRKFNSLHRQAYAVRRKAERNCRKLNMGSVPWSPQFADLKRRQLLWKILIKAKQGCRISSRKLRRLMRQTSQPQAWELTLPELLANQEETNAIYRTHKRYCAAQRRKDHVAYRQSALQQQPQSPAIKARRQRVQRMRQREEVRRRRKAQGKGGSGGLKVIQIETTSQSGVTATQLCESKATVEQGCIDENRSRFDQTRFPHPTPPMQEPLYSTFTGMRAQENSMSLLRGSLTLPTGIDRPTKAFLDQCRFHQEFSPLQLTIDTDDHVDFWSKMGEHKGSEPHGLHNGHYKAAIASDMLSTCDATFRHIPLQTGFVPSQWKYLMNFAIEKKPGEIRVTKMRTIQLMNSEMNSNNKKIGKEAMEFAESHNLIPPGQSGSRKRHQAIDVALSKRLVWDLLILQRRAAGWISNDAKSCFDRIVHWVAIICLLQFGIPWNALVSMFKALETATHRVRTGFGDSAATFSPPSPTPFQGAGQGNGAGPQMWVAISSVLIRMLTAAGHGFECLSAIAGTLVAAVCFAFVDDTDVIEAAKTVNQRGEELLSAIQQAISLWAGGILATGGAINPEKSFWWLIDFKWEPGTGAWRFRRSSDMSGDLTMIGPDGTSVTLRRLEPDEPEKTLGVTMAPLDDGRQQAAVLASKAKKWAEHMRTGHLLKYDVFPLIRTTILKTLEYPMAVTTLSAQTWTNIMAPVLTVCLPKAGVCRSFPRTVVMAPLKFQGLGIPHPYVLQVQHHLDVLMRHSSNRTQTYSYLDAALQCHQVETGTSYGLFQQVFDNTAILTSDTWLKRVWKEMEDLDIHLEFCSPGLALHREGDQLLMDVFINFEVDQEDLKWLNWCRQYLHVTTVSDITTADGRFITASAWEGSRCDQRNSPYEWPRTTRPPEHRWEVWRDAVSKTLIRTSSHIRELKVPLGLWTDDLQDWLWLFSPSNNALFHRTGHVWKRAEANPGARRTQSYAFNNSLFSFLRTVSVPDDAQRVSVLKTGSDFQITGIGHQTNTTQKNPTSLLDKWKEAYQDMQAGIGWTADDIQIVGSEQRLLEALAQGKIRIVSDGSYKSELGTAALQLTTKSRKDTIWLRCQTPGSRKDQSAYRSELIGLLLAVDVTQWMYDLATDQGLISSVPKVVVGCDGQSALFNSFSDKPLHPCQAQFDLLSSIRGSLGTSPVSWQTRWIEGHADDIRSWSSLSWWERRNVEVDLLATRFRRELENQGVTEARNPKFLTEPCALFLHGIKQSRLDPAVVQEAIVLPTLEKYWASRHRIPEGLSTIVDWTAMHRAMTALPPGIQRWTTKHTVGMCGVGKFRVRWGLDDANHCPRCGSPEDHLHVPRCPSVQAAATWRTHIVQLQQWMMLENTDPDITQFVIQTLGEVRTTPPTLMTPLEQPLPSSLLHTAITKQKSLGPQGLLEGLLVGEWSTLQSQFFQSKHSRKSGDLWASRLIQRLLKLGFAMWEDRNSAQHSDESFANQRESRSINLAIRADYSLGFGDLPAQYHPLLRRPLDKILQQSLADRRSWLEWITAERRLAKRSLSRQRRMMHTFTHSRSAG